MATKNGAVRVATARATGRRYVVSHIDFSTDDAGRIAVGLPADKGVI